MRGTRLLYSIVLGAAMVFGWPGHYAGPAFAADIVIGTGGRTGVYFHVGRAICELVNRTKAEHGIGCTAPSTAGSIANLRNLRAGKLQIAVAQSDWQYHATKGTSRFKAAGPDTDLRALFSVHGEPFTVVARRDSGIRTLDDLKGRRVNIGNPGSGQRATMEVVMAAKGWTKRTFSLANELSAAEHSLALCHDQVHAIVYTVGHPNASVEQAVRLCRAVLVEIKGPAIDKLLADNPFYASTRIPGGLYAGNDKPVTTFGVKATVVTSAKIDVATIYLVMKAVFDNLESFKRKHPAFAGLDAKAMARDGLSAPLHPGAKRYFEEKGLR
ncbi:MAG: TAXI family TRAP transporter solute-binding subunit [Pseudomonadota bacterium]